MDKYPKPSAVPSMATIGGFVALILACCTGIGGVIANYLKFQKLHNYIKNHPEKQTRKVPPSGLRFILVSIGGALLAGIVFVAIYVIMLALVGPLFLSQGKDPSQFTYIMTIVGGVVAGIAFLLCELAALIMNYRWQVVYNERARMLMSKKSR